MKKVFETERLIFRPFTYKDFDKLSELLKDIEVMYAWEHSFSDEEVSNWIEDNISRYEDNKTGYMALIDKNTGNFIGQAGLHYTIIGNKKILEIGYIIGKNFWNQGYAYEAAEVFIEYAFKVIGEKEIYALIRPENLSSVKLAKKLGFFKISSFIKNYRGKDMIHDIYFLQKDNKL